MHRQSIDISIHSASHTHTITTYGMACRSGDHDTYVHVCVCVHVRVCCVVGVSIPYILWVHCTGWVIGATPEGTPPANGWPVYVSFTTDTFPVREGTCGEGRMTRKNYTAFDTPTTSMSSCFNASKNTSTEAAVRDDCDAAMTKVGLMET